MFVATDLTSFESPDPQVFAADVVVSDRAHRRLDPAYYAWLRSRMVAAKRETDAGRLAAASFVVLRERFEALHAFAVARFGEDALRAAVSALDAKRYDPPRVDRDEFPGRRWWRSRTPDSHGCGHMSPSRDFPFTEPVPFNALLRVDNIRERALGLDWTEAGLFQNQGHLRFPYGDEWGLICFLGEDGTIAAVEREAITIERRGGASTRFPNRNVEQPWRRAAESPRA